MAQEGHLSLRVTTDQNVKIESLRIQVPIPTELAPATTKKQCVGNHLTLATFGNL